MPKTYSLGDAAAEKLLARTIKKWYPDLVKEKVNVALLMIMPPLGLEGKPTGPAIRTGKHEVTARCCIVSPHDHPLMGVDVIIEVDAYKWERMPEEEQAALLDHELHHPVIAVDSEGKIKRHPDGRVMLDTRPDDWHLTGFVKVLQRHGRHALEGKALKELDERLGQGTFGFMKKRKAS